MFACFLRELLGASKLHFRRADPRRSIARCAPLAAAALIAIAASVAFSSPLGADDGKTAAEGNDAEEIAPEALTRAVERAVELVQQSATVYREQRQCFSCHHQAIPVLMLVEAQQRGFAVDAENLQQQVEHTAKHLRRGRESYLEGEGQGGKADTAGWALWTLETGDWSADETTEAVTEFLLAWHRDRGHWRANSRRLPTEGSDFTTTYVAMRGLEVFGSSAQREPIAQRREAVLQWLEQAEPADTEDHVFRLRMLDYLGVEAARRQEAADQLISLQRDDGGWGQTPEMESDAYATGSALAALQETGGLGVTEPAYRRGLAYLLRTQLDDGSWHVATHSKPIQVYFESGFPHEKDQFISMAATSWAATAILLACPPREAGPESDAAEQ